ncbi:MAG: T9SS type A sorting domain-containing protein [Chitinophagaceae bacterium]|nr:T9SS type A sorting domain-containing protein [Chitinophagaceae bacterium]
MQQQRNSATAQQRNSAINFLNPTRYLFMLAILLSSILFSGQGYAQFVNPIYPQVPYPNPVSIGDYLNNTRTTYISNFSTETGSPSTGLAVSVIGWSYDDASAPYGGMIAAGTHIVGASSVFTGDATLPILSAVDIRVAYMEPFIVAAYWETTTSQYIMEWYSYIPGSGFINPVPFGSFALPTFAPPTSYERISMDINDDATKGAIVYSSGGVVYGYAFQLTGGTIVPYFTTPYALSTGTGNTQPDIVFSTDGTTLDDYVYITYHNGGLNLTGSMTFSGGTPPFFTSGFATLPAFDVFSLPSGVTRVNMDVPPGAPTGLGQWAYTYSDGNNVYLHYEDASSVISTISVNDGTLGGLPTDISPYSNIAPVLSYTHANEIQVAWASDALGYYSLIPPYTQTYISTIVDVNASGGPKTSSGSDYLIIDSFDTHTYVTARPLIALNRHSMTGNRFVSFGIEDPVRGYELYHKNIEEFQPIYLTSIGNVHKAAFIKLYPNPFSSSIKLELPSGMQNEVWVIRVTDLFGRTVANYKGTKASDFVAQSSAIWQAGQYIVKIENANIEPQILKIIKQ